MNNYLPYDEDGYILKKIMNNQISYFIINLLLV